MKTIFGTSKRATLLISLGIMITLMFAGLVSASSLGTVKQNDCITLYQSCPSCSYVNLTAIKYPNVNVEVMNLAMEKSDSEYNYTFCNTAQIGEHFYTVKGDKDGVISTETISFEVTPSGFINTLGLYIIFLVVLGSIIILGFSINEAWFVVIGGMGLIMLGIYSINYGIVGFKDMFMTWGTGLFEIGVGATLSIGAAWQKLYYD